MKERVAGRTGRKLEAPAALFRIINGDADLLRHTGCIGTTARIDGNAAASTVDRRTGVTPGSVARQFAGNSRVTWVGARLMRIDQNWNCRHDCDSFPDEDFSLSIHMNHYHPSVEHDLFRIYSAKESHTFMETGCLQEGFS